MKTIGMHTWTLGKLRIQVYWPELTLSKAEVFLGIDTVARFVNQPGKFYWGIGAKILGVGIGFDCYYAPSPEPQPREHT